MPDEHAEREWESVNKKSRAGLIVVAIVAVVFLVFILSNTEDANIEFVSWKIEMPEWLLFAGLFLLGAVFGWAGSSLRRRSKHTE